MATENEYFKPGVEYKTRDGRHTCVLMYVMEKPEIWAFPAVFLRKDMLGNQSIITRRSDGRCYPAGGRDDPKDVLYQEEKFIALVRYKGENKVWAMSSLSDTHEAAENVIAARADLVLVGIVSVQVPI